MIHAPHQSVIDEVEALYLVSMAADHGVGKDAALGYLEYFEQHVSYVREAGQRLMVHPFRLAYHDRSKLEDKEFPHYARRFFGNNDDPDGFAMAWLHHENANDHHWAHWIPRSGKKAGQPLPMPEEAIREMIADWCAAQRQQTGSWDMSEWLTKKAAGFNIHIDTHNAIHKILHNELGYQFDGPFLVAGWEPPADWVF